MCTDTSHKSKHATIQLEPEVVEKIVFIHTEERFGFSALPNKQKKKKTIMINVFVLTITYNLNIKSKISENEPHQLHLSIIFHNIKDCNETVTMTTI